MIRKNRRQSGSAIIEAAIALPFLLLIALALADAYFILTNYYALNHIAREASVTATIVSRNIVAEGIELNDGEVNCATTGVLDTNCLQSIINERVSYLIRSFGLRECANANDWGCLITVGVPAQISYSGNMITIKLVYKYNPVTLHIPGLGSLGMDIATSATVQKF